MATGRLIGPADSANDIGGAGADYFQGNRFQALATGQVTEFKVKVKVAGNIKIAIYADSSSEPGSRLWYNNTGQYCTTGWNTFTVTPALNITKDTYYWLMFNCDTSDFVANQSASSGTLKYKSAAYSGFTFPDPAGSGFSSAAATRFLAGWGILVLIPSTITSAEAVSQPKLIFILSPSTIASQEAVGSPVVQLAGTYVQPATIPSAEVVGSPTLIKLLQFVLPETIPSGEVVGQPSLRYQQFLVPITIPSAEVIGIPSIGVFGIIAPLSILSAEVVGGPVLLKYVWHVILDALYSTETPDINRAYIIGRDIYGNPIYGEAHDTAESALVGQRLDFRQELAIPTTAQAGNMASAVLSKMRLTGRRAVILIPPNCGQELFDLVQIIDKQANQSDAKYRVVGVRFEYNPRQARYHHKLILGAS